MQILVKVIEHEWINTVITQELIDSEVIIDESLAGFGVATFSVPMIPIQEDNKIELYEIGNTDTLIFSGYVYKVEPVRNQFGILNIECRSEKALFNKRLFLKEKSSYNVQEVANLPVYPATVVFGVNYRQHSIYGVSFYKGTVVPKAPAAPYYQYGFTSFTGTTFLVEQIAGEIWRVEDGVLIDEGPGTGVDINLFLTDIIDDYQDFNEPRTYETDFNEDVSVGMQKGDNYFDVIDEIARQKGALWDIQNGKIIFKRNFGNDYTTGPEYREIIYNALFPNTANIKNISVVGTATRSNIVMAQNNNSDTILDTSGYVDRVYGVSKESFRDGNLYENLQRYLQDNNKLQRLYSVEVEQNTLDVKVGDKVKLIVENTNSFFDIDTSVVITNKKTTYTNASKQITYKVGDINVSPFNIENWLYGMQKSIKLNKVG